MKITERILQILEYKGISKYKFHKDLGLSNGFLDKSRDIGTDKYAKILEYFPDINPTWLLTGEGEMLRDKGEVTVISGGGEVKDRIPLVSVDVAAGFGSMSFGIEERDIIDYYVIPVFKDVDFMVPLTGESMIPNYKPGDIVACRILHQHRYIQWNKAYIIATRDQGLLCKRLKPSGRERSYIAVSDNRDYDDFEIPEEEITGIALIVGILRME